MKTCSVVISPSLVTIMLMPLVPTSSAVRRPAKTLINLYTSWMAETGIFFTVQHLELAGASQEKSTWLVKQKVSNIMKVRTLSHSNTNFWGAQKWVRAQMCWGLNVLGPKWVVGPNELGPKCVGAQMSQGPKWVGTKWVRGPNEEWAQMCPSHSSYCDLYYIE